MAKRIDGLDSDDAVDHEQDMRPVMLPSNAVFHVHKDEVGEWNARVSRYLNDNHFPNSSDLADLDRVMILEHLVLRWGIWISMGHNYWKEPINENELHTQIKNTSTEIRGLKSSLSIDKVSRDKNKGTEDVAEFVKMLTIRAKHFGYKRNNEWAEIQEIFMELRGRLKFWENMDEQERREQRTQLEDIFIWFNDVALPRYDEIDRQFRNETPAGLTGEEAAVMEGGQKTWILDQ